MMAMMRFMGALLRMPKQWLAWLGLLLAVNLVGPWFFIETAEAWAGLAATMGGAMLMAFIHEKKGFVRLLGLGHILWVPLVVWFLLRLSFYEAGGPMYTWMVAVIALNSLSLVIDAVDVIRYIRGERESTLPARD